MQHSQKTELEVDSSEFKMTIKISDAISTFSMDFPTQPWRVYKIDHTDHDKDHVEAASVR